MNKVTLRSLLLKIRRRLPGRKRLVAQQIQQFKLHDVTLTPTSLSHEHFDILNKTPAWMSSSERLLLFALVFALRPKRYLEIGTFQGGSALLVAAAMDAANIEGTLLCIDPAPKISEENWRRLEKRTILLTGSSPQILPEALRQAGGKFDLILIDGDHSYEGAMSDAEGVLPFLAEDGYIFFHDCFFPDVQIAIDDFVKANGGRIVDIGALTRETTSVTSPTGDVSQWGGLRMLQLR